ncbi:hypothetical protein ACN28S_39445 [Cystobacter fuscus]
MGQQHLEPSLSLGEAEHLGEGSPRSSSPRPSRTRARGVASATRSRSSTSSTSPARASRAERTRGVLREGLEEDMGEGR